ncbi:MAG: alpha/beta hydrolase [Myxococcales bacterium]|nr:alpha/beta hydrolase [Myxococcales bacterium]
MSESPVETLILPGLGGSGPDHWQTRWEALYGYERVEQVDWDRPSLDAWTEALDARVRRAASPVVLVAHSLACSLVAHWARERASRGVIAALLVAPADVDALVDAMPVVRSFAPVPERALPFASAVVASADDPYVSLDRARLFASNWGSAFEDVGALGHINAASKLGDWDDGHGMLVALRDGASRGTITAT